MLSCLHYRNNELYIENISLKKIADEFGTPAYLYSANLLKQNWQNFYTAFNNIPSLICYAVKANSNIHILKLFAQSGAGFDIVSGGELARVLAANADPQKIIFSGVGKSISELNAAITANIYCINVESEAELKRLNKLAQEKNKIVNIAFRVNPHVNPHTHAHISTGLRENKFGIDIQDIIPLCRKLTEFPGVKLIGLACHIGSQITRLHPFSQAIDRMLDLYHQLQKLKIKLEHLNFGGGLGIIYHQENPPSIAEYAKQLQQKLLRLPVKLILEPGRILVGNAGVLLTRIEYIKTTPQKNFVIVDAGMNDLIRPALYDAWQPILPVINNHDQKKCYDIAGPVCESADFLGKQRELTVQENDLLAVDLAGAYGFSMSSNYNSRPRPAEILVDQDQCKLIRRRENINDLMALEENL